MEKKILIVTCFVVIAAGFFINRYQENSNKEKYAALVEQEKDERRALEAALDTVMPFNPTLEKVLKEYISVVNESPTVHNMENFRRLYYIEFHKDNGDEYLRINTDYGYNEERIKGFIRMDGNIIIYYGNPDNIAQHLVDESKLLTTIEQLAFYKDQFTISAASHACKYNIMDKENLSFNKRGSTPLLGIK